MLVQKDSFRWILAGLLLWSVVLTYGAPRECAYKNKALMIAMLALHRGENCDIALERGAQQVAALQIAKETVNTAAPKLPELEVRVMDTCSTTEQAVKAALRALVQAQQGCQGPFFLGLLGPDEFDSLRAVTKVVSVFNYPHAVASTVRSYSQFNTLNVQIYDPVVSAKSLRMMLQELNWSSFYLAFTSDSVTAQIATELAETDELCILQAVIQIPSAFNSNNDYIAYNRLLHALQKGDASRVVLICDTAESAESLLTYLDSVVSKARFVIYVLGSGLLPWKLSLETAKSVVILQETSKSPALPSTFESHVEMSSLWNEFKNQTQCHGDCAGPFVRDASTTNLVYAVHLFREALRTGMALKCHPGAGVCSQLAGMPSQDWRAHVDGTVVMINGGDDGRDNLQAKFHMVLPHEVAVVSHNEDDDNFEVIGSITEGEQIFLRRRAGLPIASTDQHEQCGRDIVILTPERPVTVPSSPTTTTRIPLDIDIFGIDIKLGHLGYYELVAILTGVVVGMVLLVLLVICFVYRCFRVESKNTYSNASSTSLDLPRKPKKSKLDRRRFFNSSVRSVHTVQE